MSSLEALGARYNNLTGSIPAELGQQVSLNYLELQNNNLSGPLPPELGNLINLEYFNVRSNVDLTGLMPRTMLNLPLGYLDISDTWICPHLDDEFQEWLDGIPRAYGLQCPPTMTERFALEEFYTAAGGDSWTNNSGWDSDSVVTDWYGVTVDATDTLVRRLALPSNGLQGSLASAIGNLRKLETLDLANNSLTGGIPVAMTSMDALDTLRVSGNADMDGPLPFLMTEMTELQALQYANTDMCASPSATFQSWIGSLEVADGATCHNPDAVRLSLPVVYLTQSIQRRSADVLLLSGREALLRVFLVGDQARAFFEPEVVAMFTREGEEVHRVVMRSIDDRLVTTADEGNLRTSYNATIPAEHMVTGLELVVVADSAETIPRAEGSQTRFPDSGSVALNVIDVPPMELTAVPVLNAAKPDSSILPWTDSIGDLGAESPQVGLFRYSFPFSEFSAKSREPYVTSLDLTDENNTWSMILELEPVYRAEKGTGYWYAVADSEDGYVRGIARLNGLVSFGKPWDTELAHEVGHNLDLLHAPCGGALGTEPDFPYPNGSIGVWGYDFRDNSVVSPERRRDIMGYCYELGWLSDYYYEKVIRVRANKDETWTNEEFVGHRTGGRDAGAVGRGAERRAADRTGTLDVHGPEAAGGGGRLPGRRVRARRPDRVRPLLHPRRGQVREQVLLLRRPDRGRLGGLAGTHHADGARGRGDGGPERSPLAHDRDGSLDRADPGDSAGLEPGAAIRAGGHRGARGGDDAGDRGGGAVALIRSGKEVAGDARCGSKVL